MNYPANYNPLTPQYQTTPIQGYLVFMAVGFVFGALACYSVMSKAPTPTQATKPEPAHVSASPSFFDAQASEQPQPSKADLAQQITTFKQQHGLKLYQSGKCNGAADKCNELSALVKQWEGAK